MPSHLRKSKTHSDRVKRDVTVISGCDDVLPRNEGAAVQVLRAGQTSPKYAPWIRIIRPGGGHAARRRRGEHGPVKLLVMSMNLIPSPLAVGYSFKR